MTLNQARIATALALCAVGVLASSRPGSAQAPETAAPVPDVAAVGPAADLSTLGTDVNGPDGSGPLAVDTLPAQQDTFISSAQPDTNFGGNSRLNVGERSPFGATRTAIQFDMSRLARSRAVTRARLRLNLADAGPSGDVREIPIYRVTSRWQEGSLTWNQCNDCVDPRRWDTVNMGTATGWYEWNATELAQRWRWPSWQSWHFRNDGFGVQGYETAGSFRGFSSRETSSGPQLELTNVADTLMPTSALLPMTQYINAPDSGRDFVTMRLRWDGSDPEPATGIDYFWVLVKINNGPFNQLTSSSNSPAADWRRYDTNFQGHNGKIYNFVTYATDMAGNRQPDKPNPDWITHVDWSAPVTTMPALPPYVRGDIQLTWSGQDMPQGVDLIPTGIQTYEVWFNVNNSSWGLAETLPAERTSTFFVNPIDDANYQFQIIGVDRAGNRTPFGPGQVSTTVDRRPPNTVVNPIEKPLAALSFSVSWLGNDGLGSGVDTYDVETATGLGAWTAWQTGTRATSATFTGRLGNVYGFRARATDKAGSTGQWSAPQWAAVIEPSALTHRVQLPRVDR